MFPIWKVKKGNGSFITFDMGEKVTYKKKNGSECFTGSIHLWVYLCDWIVVNSGKIILQSENSEEQIISGLNSLKIKK